MNDVLSTMLAIKNLWIDDIRPAPPGWECARTINSAIEMLANNSYEEVSLDRDISLKITANGVSRPYPIGESFEAVAYYLVLISKLSRPKKITVHSSNKSRGNWMADFLRAYGYDVARVYMQPSNRLELESAGEIK